MKFSNLISEKDYNEFDISINGYLEPSFADAIITLRSVNRELPSWVDYNAIALIDIHHTILQAYNGIPIAITVSSTDIDGMLNAITDHDIKEQDPVTMNLAVRNTRVYEKLKAFIKASANKIIICRSLTTRSAAITLKLYDYKVPKSKEKQLFKIFDKAYNNPNTIRNDIIVDRIEIVGDFVKISVSDEMYDQITKALMTPAQLEGISYEKIIAREQRFIADIKQDIKNINKRREKE